ncbi:MAG: class I SAM-dependent methyltransferase [Rothia sp. (in: high G+C Gram-positive bacteria)]|nr:class I SAM-dependent methyltransferase [Rothia sp. (in: high G+C Gram-positive bacteria)]
MREKSQWQIQVEKNPGHSQWYIQRFKTMQEAGNDIYGEARLIDALIPRAAKILDAGCGPGRLGTYLHNAGHTVTGVDIDSELIAEAQRVCPEATWVCADLSDLREALGESPDAELGANGFDAIVCAGNVMTFLAPSTRLPVLENMRATLSDSGRAVIGFGANRGYDFEQFFADAAAARLQVEQKFSTWDLRPFSQDSGFLVAVLTR